MKAVFRLNPDQVFIVGAKPAFKPSRHRELCRVSIWDLFIEQLLSSGRCREVRNILNYRRHRTLQLQPLASRGA
ncbi:unnamed protein product [Pleuronectes platessa]|uniref:Uncharacterized protein n=1 Tax=Pleuronectes platessa TaxID=8262 RepID=A0A9N7YFL3_PLEPL|nr:unnamed protein product [Pleuronectes platessa]